MKRTLKMKGDHFLWFLLKCVTLFHLSLQNQTWRELHVNCTAACPYWCLLPLEENCRLVLLVGSGLKPQQWKQSYCLDWLRRLQTHRQTDGGREVDVPVSPQLVCCSLCSISPLVMRSGISTASHGPSWEQERERSVLLCVCSLTATKRGRQRRDSGCNSPPEPIWIRE